MEPPKRGGLNGAFTGKAGERAAPSVEILHAQYVDENGYMVRSHLQISTADLKRAADNRLRTLPPFSKEHFDDLIKSYKGVLIRKGEEQPRILHAEFKNREGDHVICNLEMTLDRLKASENKGVRTKPPFTYEDVINLIKEGAVLENGRGETGNIIPARQTYRFVKSGGLAGFLSKGRLVLISEEYFREGKRQSPSQNIHALRRFNIDTGALMRAEHFMDFGTRVVYERDARAQYEALGTKPQNCFESPAEIILNRMREVTHAVSRTLTGEERNLAPDEIRNLNYGTIIPDQRAVSTPSPEFF